MARALILSLVLAGTGFFSFANTVHAGHYCYRQGYRGYHGHSYHRHRSYYPCYGRYGSPHHRHHGRYSGIGIYGPSYGFTFSF